MYDPSIEPNTEIGKGQRDGNEVFFLLLSLVSDGNTSKANQGLAMKFPRGKRRKYEPFVC